VLTWGVGMRFFLLMTGISVLVVPGPTRADMSQFRVERLRVPGRAVGIHTEDMNGDGKRDLAVAFLAGRPPSSQRKVALFFDQSGSYKADPDQVIDPPAAASFLDFVDVDGDGKRALIYADGRNLMAYRLEGGRYEAVAKPLTKATGLLALPDYDDLPFFDVGRDWDGDGKPEILLPLVEGVGVYTREAGWARVAFLRLAPRADYSVRTQLYEPRNRNFQVRATFVLPELISADYDGDGKLDLCAIIEDLLQVHKGGAGPTVFSQVASARHYLGVRTEHESMAGAGHVHTTVRDIDGDGVADLVINKITGGLGQMRAQTGFYYGKKGGGYAPPAQMLQRDGYAGAVAFADLDGDGKLDLVMPHVAVGLGEMARVLLSKKMMVGWEARRNLGRKFSTDPETTKDIDFPVDYSQLADINGAYPSVAGDFNADGKADFVASHGLEQIGVWLGGGPTLIADSPKALVRVTPSKYYQVVDLDGDKRADVVVFYRGKDALSGVVNVLRNTGQGW
jgi:hypothetical protein